MENITILIGDDDVEIADLVAIHLEGYRVIKVLDGQENINVIQT
ncbi:hypothetical protein PAV_2c05320 [Paenibacillus alvei DSM 29]|nr:hypothetical protein PAV_2c05320 [Paenibacillus alvei DSM 29]